MDMATDLLNAAPRTDGESFVARCGADLAPSWRNHRGDSYVATMSYWAGRGLLELGDPVGTAVGLQWIAEAFGEAGVQVGTGGNDHLLLDTAAALGPPEGDVAAWVLALLVTSAAAELRSYQEHEATLVGPLWWATLELGGAVARCMDLVASPPSRALVVYLRHRRALSVAAAAQRCGLSARQWSHAETGAATSLSRCSLYKVAAGFGFDAAALEGVLEARRPLPLLRDHIDCGDGHEPVTLTLTAESLWCAAEDHGTAHLPAWLAPGGYTLRCPGCGRRYAMGGLGLYLLGLPYIPGSPRRRPQALARHLDA